jgi:predicted nucleotidyltransferase
LEFDVEKTIAYWLEGADYDLGVAEAMFRAKKYPYALFMGHLALEKLLKALVVKNTGQHAPLTHSLPILAERSGVPMPATVRRYARALARAGVHVDRLVLFGSWANGRPVPESDIDVAVVSRDFGRDTTEEGMFLFRVAGDVDPRLEPVALSPESYERDTWVPLVYEIRTTGREVKLR